MPGGLDEDDPFAGTQDVKRVKPEAVNYAKRAKRVDVKRLKDNIWKGLKIPAVTSKDNDAEAEVSALGNLQCSITLTPLCAGGHRIAKRRRLHSRRGAHIFDCH